MVKKVYIKPNKHLIKLWIDTLVPHYDVYFFKNFTNISEIDNNLISMDEYLKVFSSIEYINAYEHWNVKNTAKYVYVDYNNNVISNDNFRNCFYDQQIECDRGLILSDVNEDLNKYTYKGKIILSNYLFNNLMDEEKEKLAIQYARCCDDWIGYIDSNIPLYIRKFANKFVEEDGCNCLATSIYGATGDEEILFCWMDEDTFIEKLQNLKYEKIDGEFKTGDIVVFENKGKIIHACYCANNELFLNKSGQSRFNPIVLLPFESIVNDWQDCEYSLFRKHDN